jgi:hypothetical protein
MHHLHRAYARRQGRGQGEHVACFCERVSSIILIYHAYVHVCNDAQQHVSTLLPCAEWLLRQPCYDPADEHLPLRLRCPTDAFPPAPLQKMFQEAANGVVPGY